MISLDLSSGERIGLVGPNGVGKPTLLKLLAGIETVDEGQIVVQSGISIGYLPQDFSQFTSHNVAAILSSARSRTEELQKRADFLESELGRADVVSSSAYQSILDEYLHSLQRLDQIRYGDCLARMDRIVRGLNLSSIDETRPFHTLSGVKKLEFGLQSFSVKILM